jgi:hypothetical protein
LEKGSLCCPAKIHEIIHERRVLSKIDLLNLFPEKDMSLKK